MKWTALVPELSVTDLSRSRAFYTDVLGFEVLFERPETRFVYLGLGKAQLTLEELAEGRGWRTGGLEYLLGHGLNLQIEVGRLEPLLSRPKAAGHPLFVPPEKTWYRQDKVLHGRREFLV